MCDKINVLLMSNFLKSVFMSIHFNRLSHIIFLLICIIHTCATKAGEQTNQLPSLKELCIITIQDIIDQPDDSTLATLNVALLSSLPGELQTKITENNFFIKYNPNKGMYSQKNY